MKYNQNAFGQTLKVDFGQDVSTATSLEIILTPQQGGEKTVTATLGATASTLDDQSLAANQWAYYVTQSGDLDDYVGLWEVQGKAVLASQTIYSDKALMRVVP